MTKCFFEIRKQSARGTDSIAADIMRHLHARQYLGKAVVICEQPVALMAASRKQWLKLTRTIQKQRSSTLNAEKILKYTHTITRMQQQRFTHKPPLDDPEADVYFLAPEDCAYMPPHCYSLYVVMPLSASDLKPILKQAPTEALVVDYDHTAPWEKYGLKSKADLEQHVLDEWQQVKHFLTAHKIDAAMLAKSGVQDIEVMDDALDILLGMSHQFLRIANEFQRSLELARPLRISLAARKEYDAVMLLAYRVQALSPGAFTQHFLETFNEDDTFFLSDDIRRMFLDNQALCDIVERHYQARRPHLAKALLERANSCKN